MVNVLSPDHFLVARRKLPSLDNEANNRSLAKQTGVPRLACLLAASKDQPDTQPERASVVAYVQVSQVSVEQELLAGSKDQLDTLTESQCWSSRKLRCPKSHNLLFGTTVQTTLPRKWN